MVRGTSRHAQAAIDAAGRPSLRPSKSAYHEQLRQWYWRFYLASTTGGARARTTFFNSRTVTPDACPANAIVVAEADARDRFAQAGWGLSEMASTREPQGTVSFYVWTKKQD